MSYILLMLVSSNKILNYLRADENIIKEDLKGLTFFDIKTGNKKYRSFKTKAKPLDCLKEITHV